MSDLWVRVRQLTGQTLPLLTREGAFDIIEADEKYLFLVPQSTGKQRRLYRSSFEMAEQMGLASGEAIPSQLSAAGVTGRNSSYIAAILHHLNRGN